MILLVIIRFLFFSVHMTKYEISESQTDIFTYSLKYKAYYYDYVLKISPNKFCLFVVDFLFLISEPDSTNQNVVLEEFWLYKHIQSIKDTEYKDCGVVSIRNDSFHEIRKRFFKWEILYKC